MDQRALPLAGSCDFALDGSGVELFIIDTGIRETHVDFNGRGSQNFDSIGDGRNGRDCHGHGAHAAGTAAGDAHGLAKDAGIHAVRVLDRAGSGIFAGVITGSTSSPARPRTTHWRPTRCSSPTFASGAAQTPR